MTDLHALVRAYLDRLERRRGDNTKTTRRSGIRRDPAWLRRLA